MKKIIIPTLMVLLLLTSCDSKEEKKVLKHYNTATVQVWWIELWESYIWYAEGIKQLPLSTKSPWRISYLKAVIWDKINIGELLVSLETSEAKVWYSTASNIIESMNSIKKHTSLSYEEQIKVLEKNIEEIKESEKWIINNSNNLEELNKAELQAWLLEVTQAETQVETNKLELEQTTNLYKWNKQDIYKSWKNIITNSVILNTNIIYFTDELLWVTPENKDKNDKFEDYLWTKNTKVLNETKQSFIKTNALFVEYKSYYENTIENNEPSNEEIISWLNKWLALSEQIKELLNLMYKTLDNSIENVYLTLDTISLYKEKISTFWNQIEKNILSAEWYSTFWLKGTVDSLNSLEREYTKNKTLLEKKIILSEDSLNTIKQNLEKIEANSNINIDNESTKKEVILKQIESLNAQIERIKSEKSVKLKEVDSSIVQIVGERNIAWVQIESWKIYSPIKWVILEKLVEQWEIINAWTPVYIVWDDSTIKLKIEIWLNIVEQIEKWTKVKILFEWIDEIMTWEVSNISSSKDSQTKKIKVEIIVKNENKKIKIWSIAKVFIKSKKENTKNLIIPNSSIINKFSIPWVYVLQNWKANFKKINITKQNEKFSEIIWLKEWEIIITDWKDNIYDWEILNK